MTYKLIAYYTPRYSNVIAGLQESAKRLGLDLHVRQYPEQSSWLKAVYLKPQFILDSLLEFKQPVAYVDADAVIWSAPDLFDHIRHDIGIHYLNDTQACGGTLFFNYTPQAIDLCREWIKRCKEDGANLDQKILEQLLEDRKGFIDVYRLPANYCLIFDLMKSDNPVIVHYQASRHYRGEDRKQ